jgi:hypothetical protein
MSVRTCPNFACLYSPPGKNDLMTFPSIRLLNQPSHSPVAFIVVEMQCIVVAGSHYAAAFTALSPAPRAAVPISRMTSCSREARALFQKPEDLIKIVIRRHECDCYRYRVDQLSQFGILWSLGPQVPQVSQSLGDFPFHVCPPFYTLTSPMTQTWRLPASPICTQQPHNVRDIHCQMKGQISKLEVWQLIKTRTKESGPNNWVPGAKK